METLLRRDRDAILVESVLRAVDDEQVEAEQEDLGENGIVKGVERMQMESE